ncbi:MAG: hypothetical protein WBS20_08900, partial [Lysobacterales bacterium]
MWDYDDGVMSKKLTTDEFVRRAREVHGGRYDYSLVKYVNGYTPVSITCRKHGRFEQQPAVHFRGSGCPACATEKQTMRAEVFIQRATEIHGARYDYSKVKYKTARIGVTIICRKHGAFKQLPDNHLHGLGCLKCGVER